MLTIGERATPSTPALGFSSIYVKADGFYYTLNDAGVETQLGAIGIATQAEQETGTDVVRAVTPGRQHFHPSAAKAWVDGTSTAGINASYNVSSITDLSVGAYRVNWNTDFSSSAYCVIATVTLDNSGNSTRAITLNKAVGSVEVVTNYVTSLTGPGGAGSITETGQQSWNCMAFGDQ